MTSNAGGEGTPQEPAPQEPGAEVEPSAHLSLRIAYGDAEFSAEGSGDLVLQAFGSFKDHLEPHQPRSRPPAQTRESGAAADATSTSETDAATVEEVVSTAQPEIPLPVFLKQYKLKNNAQTAAAIAVWAKRYGGTNELSINAITELWRHHSGLKLPANLNRDVSTAAKEGWLTKVDRGSYAPTKYGEESVDKFPPASS